jgi:hypothetical protein
VADAAMSGPALPTAARRLAAVLAARRRREREHRGDNDHQHEQREQPEHRGIHEVLRPAVSTSAPVHRVNRPF